MGETGMKGDGSGSGNFVSFCERHAFVYECVCVCFIASVAVDDEMF